LPDVANLYPPVDIFSIPLLDRHLLYAPLHGIAALIDSSSRQYITQYFLHAASPPSSLSSLLDSLRLPVSPPVISEAEQLGKPLFLGLITTRGCNMACVYCDFVAPKLASPVMAIPLARQAVDAYLRFLQERNYSSAEIHFFGGEPFAPARLVHFIVEYARAKTSQLGMDLRLEAITNGLFSRRYCQWISDTFDTLVLSMDGPADIHDRLRPALNGKATFSIVAENARQLSASGAELILRACVTQETVHRLADIAAYFAAQFSPQAVCFEALVPSALSASAGLEPPDPWDFALNFIQAAGVLQPQGIETVLSTAATFTCQLSFCPVGKDAIIISPDGQVNACYLLEEDWRAQGLELSFGQINTQTSAFELDLAALKAIRRLNVDQYSLCTNCFCRYHCAGGCHVKRHAVLASSTYDDTCIQTRLVTLANLLDRLGEAKLKQAWLADRSALQAAVLQANDRLL
jgi:uncharacterized protein